MLYESRLDGSQVVIESSHDKRYGILLSGGLDSAVLLYMILKAYPGIDIRAFTIDKADGAMKYAQKVVDYANSRFKRQIPAPIAVGNPLTHHSLMNISAMRDVLDNNRVDFLFNALNQNPEELASLPGAPARAKTSNNPRIYLPFLNLYKTHIVDFMFQYEQEELMNITHSCTEQPVGRCNKCWQCGERAWTFSKLVKEDTGKL